MYGSSKRPVSIVGIAIVLIGACAPGDALQEEVAALNIRIETAAAQDREWPKFPGGLAAFLFEPDALVGRGFLYFPAADGSWRAAAIARHPNGTWRIASISPGDSSDVAELIERRDFLRRASIESRGIDPETQGPLDLLELLKTWESADWLAPHFPFGWVKETDLPSLVALLDSTEPCANVRSMVSSVIIRERSTVGNEAAYLIEGFRKDRYPPGLVSNHPLQDIEEIEAWWRARGGASSEID